MPSDRNEVPSPLDLPSPRWHVIEACLRDIRAVDEVLQERMADFAQSKGWRSFWEGLEDEVGLQLPGVEIEGFIVGWLETRPRRSRQKPKSKLRDRLENTLSEIAAIEEDLETDVFYAIPTCANAAHATLHVLRSHADQLRLGVWAEEARNISTMKGDLALLNGLKDYFEGSGGGNVTSGERGKFGRLVSAIWEVLPPDRRPSSPETLISYVRKILPKHQKRKPR